MHITENAPRYIEWDMGTYGPFPTEADARAFQRAHKMTGSSITTETPAS